MFDTHHKSLHAYCLRRLAVEDANDAISDVFLVAWRRIDEIPAGDETLMWLYGVARNVVRNRQRSSRRQIRLIARTGSVAVELREGLETIVIRNEEHAAVLRAMGTLKESDQDLLDLKVWEDLPNAAIAAILGISHRAVEGRYARALKRLSKQLERGPAVAQRSSIPVEKGEATT